MTYDTREKSQYEGEPVECYRFTHGASTWLFTSADRAITLPAGTFEPDTISRGEQDHSQEDGAGTIEVVMPRTSPVAGLFIPYIPVLAVNLTVYRAHRGEESTSIALFVGRVSNCRFVGSEAIMLATPISQMLKRRLPRVESQHQCNWTLYGPGCEVLLANFSDPILVTTVTGSTVVSGDFTGRPDGWYNGGWLERSDGDKRFVVDHVGNTVTLMNPFIDLASLETVTAVAGCDRLEPTCETKFSNLDNHFGFARIPFLNPHTNRFDL